MQGGSMAGSAQNDLLEGDDVVVTFPSGREVGGRIEEEVGTAEFAVWVDEYRDTRLYPRHWVRAWSA